MKHKIYSRAVGSGIVLLCCLGITVEASELNSAGNSKQERAQRGPSSGNAQTGASSGAKSESGVLRFADVRSLLLKHNGVVQAAELDLEAKKSEGSVFGRSFLPEVSATYGVEKFRIGKESSKTEDDWAVEAKVNLFRGGQDYIAGKVADLEVSSLQVTKAEVLSEQLRMAYELYWEIYFLNESKKLLDEHLSLNQTNLKGAEKRIRAGLASQSDRFEFQMRHTELKQERLELETLLEIKSRQFRQTVGLTDGRPLNLEDIHFHNWEKDLENINYSESYEVKKNKLSEEIAAAQVRGTKGTLLPSVDLYGGVASLNGRQERDANSETEREDYVGIRATWSLGDMLSYQPRARGLQAKLKAQEVKNKYSHEWGRAELEARLAQLKNLHSFVHKAEDNIKLAQGYYSISMKDYSRGIKSSSDALSATERLIKAKLKLLEIRKQFNSLYSLQLVQKDLQSEL